MWYANWRSIRPTHQLPTVLSISSPIVPMPDVQNRVLLYETVYYLIAQWCAMLIGGQFNQRIDVQLCFPPFVQLCILPVVSNRVV